MLLSAKSQRRCSSGAISRSWRSTSQWIGILVVARPLVLHAVLLGESLDLAVAEHGQAGQRGHHRRHAEALVALAELIDGGALVGIAHEVDVALHDVRIELQRVLDDRAVLGVVLVAQHDHEGAVVDAMHAQGADEVALHEPEGLGQQQRAGNFGGHAIHHLAPELVRHVRSNSAWLMPYSAREGMAPLLPGPGNQSR